MSDRPPARYPEYCRLDDALFAAYHEAGHAVAALLDDVPGDVAGAAEEHPAGASLFDVAVDVS